MRKRINHVNSSKKCVNSFENFPFLLLPLLPSGLSLFLFFVCAVHHSHKPTYDDDLVSSVLRIDTYICCFFWWLASWQAGKESVALESVLQNDFHIVNWWTFSLFMDDKFMPHNAGEWINYYQTKRNFFLSNDWTEHSHYSSDDYSSFLLPRKLTWIQ